MSDDRQRNLVEQATRGDGNAVDALLARHLPALLAYVRLHADPLIRQHESCADVAQSICRDVLEDMEGFEYRGDGAFRNWLCKRAMSKLVNRKRYYLAEKRDAGRLEPLIQSGSHAGLQALYASLASPSQDAIAGETIERMERAFDQLPEDQRQVIILARVVGLSHAETAVEMGRKEGAVRTMLHRALAQLGRLMDLDEKESRG